MLRQPSLRLPTRRVLALTRPHPPSTAITTTSKTLSTTRTSPNSFPSTKPTPSLLETQRLRRPVSPHLSIYRPQHTWFNPSIIGRITGCALSGGLYLFFAAYAVAPLLGWDLRVDAVAAAVAALPKAARVGAKAAVGFVGVFHCANGVRHLVWDLGKGVNTVAVRKSGWVVVGFSVCGAVILAWY
ncbi:Succinate dehydrogenase cytochrome B subunit [Lasiodiplodia theobromae]|uniref:Succinate dehydrogenase cytochrome B subunit n=1 Tax=Lasiodiplodia theobromae TaxID=45133 RepID=A0A5N5CXU1_9PEZI|nr:Succinate dehydrogenase cytochrome B subunit [Lasiodiplodia theobromae]